MGYPVVRNSTLKSHYESVERVIQAMKAQLDQPMSLQEMSRIACASPYHFNRTFRQVTGVPPAQFLYALRLDRARRLLLHTARKVIDICYDVGYNSVGTFTRRFTDLLGVSPRAFREMTHAPEAYRHATSDFPAARQTRISDCSVTGYISAPGGFQGMRFAGLFETPIPQGKPVACAIATEDGFYRIDQVPEGDFYLFALGLASPIDGPASFDYESALRSGGHLLRVSSKSVSGSTWLRLRQPSPFDPPILLVMPMLMEYYQRDGLRMPPPSATALPSLAASGD